MSVMLSGNEAAARAALHAGAKVICGYPGTPSSEVIGSLIGRGDLEGVHIEWSVNEKVAIEVAAAASWAGKRAICTMKMSGLNVAYDSLCGIAYSGAVGGLVVYVCDDPGVTTGMVEQDSRGFALMSDMPMLEPSGVQETYDFVKLAFELSEQTGAPVFVRSTTPVAQAHAAAEVEERTVPDPSPISFKKDIKVFTKAGAAICMAQHRAAIERLKNAQGILREKGLFRLTLSEKAGGLGIVSAGAVNICVDEGIALANSLGCAVSAPSVLKSATAVPYPDKELEKIAEYCSTVVVLEELEPYVERELYVTAQRLGKNLRIVGKLDGTLSRIGAYDALTCAKALCAAQGVSFPEEKLRLGAEAAALAMPRPITCCAGCPHRGTFMSVNAGVRKAGYKKDDVIVTGDIGCTILGMNPPFDTVWTELSMGASIPIAHGFLCAGADKPLIATIGDSTFLHAGIPGLLNAVQHNIDLTVIIMDNGWTAMTGMQENPNTKTEFQKRGCRSIDLEAMVRAMGVDHLTVVDPYDQPATTQAVIDALAKKGVKVILARRECAIQSNRRGIKYNHVHVNKEKCVLCKTCIRITGCPALSLGEGAVEIDQSLCNGCTLCLQTCPKAAIEKEAR
ncbi:MAG: thiamine pyrophosphate-dependent enzyme [Clostridiaceae bacterium]